MSMTAVTQRGAPRGHEPLVGVRDDEVAVRVHRDGCVPLVERGIAVDPELCSARPEGADPLERGEPERVPAEDVVVDCLALTVSADSNAGKDAERVWAESSGYLTPHVKWQSFMSLQTPVAILARRDRGRRGPRRRKRHLMAGPMPQCTAGWPRVL